MKFADYQYTVHHDAPSVRITTAPRNPSRTGYGAKIPTQWMVRTVDQKWRRVYCAIYSNIGTTYIVQDGEKVIVNIN